MASFQRKTYEIEGIQLKYEVIIATPKGKVRARAGDWIVTDQFGEQYIVSSGDFERWFERKEDVAEVKGGAFFMRLPIEE